MKKLLPFVIIGSIGLSGCAEEMNDANFFKEYEPVKEVVSDIDDVCLTVLNNYETHTGKETLPSAEKCEEELNKYDDAKKEMLKVVKPKEDQQELIDAGEDFLDNYKALVEEVKNDEDLNNTLAKEYIVLGFSTKRDTKMQKYIELLSEYQ